MEDSLSYLYILELYIYRITQINPSSGPRRLITTLSQMRRFIRGRRLLLL